MHNNFEEALKIAPAPQRGQSAQFYPSG